MNTPPRVLSIAGSDPSGGAGIEADLKVITAHGCYGMTCITAVTAQNTQGVSDIHPIPPAFVAQCLDAVLSDIGADVVKMGMLTSAETVSVVAEAVERHGIDKLVVDPVMVSTSGSQLLPSSAVDTLKAKLLPRTFLLTPNIPEALLLLSIQDSKPTSYNDLVDICKKLQALGPANVLLKGGHLPLAHDDSVAGRGQGQKVVDILFDGKEIFKFDAPWLDSKHTHGTGCSLASAIASNLAKGLSVPEATLLGWQYVSTGIKTAPQLGKGSGPINHFHSTYMSPFAPGHFVDYLIGHPKVQQAWHEYTHHPFVQGMGDSSLNVEKFKFYLIQDYLFLTQFARSNALAAYKSRNIDDVAKSAAIITHIHHEMGLHKSYCDQFDIPRAELETTPEDIATTAYTRYVLDIGMSSDYLALQVAMAPCLLGYSIIAERLKKEGKKEDNVYWQWIENYCADDYVEAVVKGRELLENWSEGITRKRAEELIEVFLAATKLEEGFWEMGWKRGSQRREDAD